MLAPNDPSLRSWLPIEKNSDFSIQNLPFGIFETDHQAPRAASILGDQVIDLAELDHLGYFNDLGLPSNVFEERYLNDFIALGRSKWREVRQRLSDLFNADKKLGLEENESQREAVLHPVSEVNLLLPIRIGDYTDFYSSKEHATNVGTMFRGPENALMPNWKHLPVGYHGRASSIVVSGTPIRRPKGQYKTADGDIEYGACRLLDFELEMGFVIGRSTTLGDTVSTSEADEHIFGLMLFNDWSARDIQAWEYVPLGPFLGKNFGSSVSPWIVTLDALEPFRVPGPRQEPKVLPYLEFSGEKNLDIQLEVALKPEQGEENVICRSNHKYLYWNMEQQVAHHTVNGCNLNVGDVMASGTISGPEPDNFGSMLELTWRGSKPLKLSDGTERKFIADGDTVIMRGWAEKDDVRVGFGEVRGEIRP